MFGKWRKDRSFKNHCCLETVKTFVVDFYRVGICVGGWALGGPVQ